MDAVITLLCHPTMNHHGVRALCLWRGHPVTARRVAYPWTNGVRGQRIWMGGAWGSPIARTLVPSFDGEHLACATRGGHVLRWAWGEEKPELVVQQGRAEVDCAWLPDGRLAHVGPKGLCIGDEAHPLLKGSRLAWGDGLLWMADERGAVAVASDGQVDLSHSVIGTVRHLRGCHGTHVLVGVGFVDVGFTRLDMDTDGITCVDYRDGRLAVGDTEGEIRVYDLQGHLTLTRQAHDKAVEVIAVDADGSVLSATVDGFLHRWDTAGRIVGHQGSVGGVTFAAGSPVSRDSRFVRIWDTGVTLEIPQLRHIHGDAESLWVTDNEGVSRYDLDGNVLWRFARHGARRSCPHPEGVVVIRADTTALCRTDGSFEILGESHTDVAVNGDRIALADRKTVQLLRPEGAVAHAAERVFWAGAWLCSKDFREVRVWDLQASRNLMELLGEPPYAAAMPAGQAATCPGRIVAARGRTLVVHDVPGGRELSRHTLPQRIIAVAVDPTGRFALTGHHDGSVARVDL